MLTNAVCFGIGCLFGGVLGFMGCAIMVISGQEDNRS